ncbi:hypothetical protein SARC_02644 [Sphaeroforma arctica JP610]|uniref:C2H2-type domain-containing protein n=1 Tax=Sphaeroforma arctica JP610 TaxID=667725 RepID=A0A0L0G8F0_9EUKA|nr:hypothetical protein SARC_02644 [Sphaeroforma arctica JP610]KNC85151.1 hypothetical protein SARC_02644 [Sphaeroforma arctica JP610]|eukprot:XP_014159053.1 hypothetical protein SARC_02644 [Sphaeroforma arctica JP610]
MSTIRSVHTGLGVGNVSSARCANNSYLNVVHQAFTASTGVASTTVNKSFASTTLRCGFGAHVSKQPARGYAYTSSSANVLGLRAAATMSQVQKQRRTIEALPPKRWCSATRAKRKVEYDEYGVEIKYEAPLVIPCSWQGCERMFSTTHNLEIHMCTHTGNQPYPCLWDNCKEVFSREDLFKLHIKQHCRDYVKECAEKKRVEERKADEIAQAEKASEKVSDA